MKNLLIVACAFLIGGFAMNAQENVDVKKETTVKKVRVTDADQVKSTTVKEVSKEKEVLVVPKDDVKEQAAVRKTTETEAVEVKNTTSDGPSSATPADAKKKMKEKADQKRTKIKSSKPGTADQKAATLKKDNK